MAHFAVVGVDQRTHEVVSTVIEARSEDEAQQIAQRQGIIVDEFKPMHPLAGAAAVEMARHDPNDRFNLPSHLEHEPDAAEPAYQGPAMGCGRPSMAGPDSENLRGGGRSPLGVASVLMILGVVAGLLWVTILRDGEAQRVLASLLPGPQSVEAAIDVTEPLGVDLAAIQGFEDWEYVHTLDIEPMEPLKAGDKLRLEAIIPPTRTAGGHRGSAVIGGRIVRPGQAIAGYRLVLIRDKHVLLQKGDRLIALRMTRDAV
jgi:hypothetical protein